MNGYTVTLTQKIKTYVEAETPQEALEKAKTKTADQKFEPRQFSVKEEIETD